MREIESLNAATSLTAEAYPAYSAYPVGAFCRQTKRVALISPFPHLYHGLTMELALRCYDVFVCHNPASLDWKAIQADLVLLDQNVLGMDAYAQATERLLRGADHPDRFAYISYTDRSNDRSGCIQWPAPADRVIEEIERRIESVPAPETAQSSTKLTYKDLMIDLKRLSVTRAGRPIDLTRTEYDLLVYFVQSGGAALSREDILKQVWGSHYFGGSNIVDAHVKSLRKKLGDPASTPIYVATVRGIGYRLAD